MIPILKGDFEGIWTSVEERTAGVEITKEAELEVKPEDVTGLLQTHDKKQMSYFL